MPPRKSAHERGYGPKWRAARIEFLQRNPWCVLCAQRGTRTEATVVDHIVPHRGDLKLFWRRTNWQGLCATDHNGAKQSAERTGVVRGCDEQGNPLDARHHWRK